MAKKEKAPIETVVETKKIVEPPTEEQVKAVKEANEQRNNDRVNRLNAIADGNDEARKDELVDTDGDRLIHADPEETERKAAEEDAAAKKEMDRLAAESDDSTVEAESEPAEQEADSDTKVVNGVTHYLQIVNGKEKWQTLEEIRRTASKVDAADEYLTTAKEAATNAARLALSQDEQSSVEEDDIEKTLSSAVMGDEGAIKKLASALKTRPSAVTPDVLQQIDERLMFRQAVDWFSDEYSDVLSDPYLKRLVTEKDSELAQAEPNLSYRQRLKKAGDEIRGWKQKISGVTATSSQDKIARKKTLVNAPSAAGKQVERTEEQEEESLEITIDKMAKARGQPQSIRHAKH